MNSEKPRPIGNQCARIVGAVRAVLSVLTIVLLAGCAATVRLGPEIDSKVEFRDLATGELRGERSYNAASSATQGIFAPVTSKQIYALVDEVIGEIKRP